MAVYNEEKHLYAAINTVLSQSFNEFHLLISDNFSTDHSSIIIDGFKNDNRITKIMPKEHMTAANHGAWLDNHIKLNFKDYEYIVNIGGHDIWSPDYLKTLISGMLENPNAAITYTDSYEIDDDDIITKKYNGYIIASEIIKPLRPLHVLVGLTHNIVYGGLWRQSIKNQIEIKHICMGIDHFLVAEASLLGDIVYKFGGHLGMRKAVGEGDWTVYIQKHLGINKITSDEGILDFKKQLHWVISLQHRAVKDNLFYGHNIIFNSLLTSLINGYISRYWNHLIAFGSIEKFFAYDEIKVNKDLMVNIVNNYKVFANYE